MSNQNISNFIFNHSENGQDVTTQFYQQNGVTVLTQIINQEITQGLSDLPDILNMFNLSNQGSNNFLGMFQNIVNQQHTEEQDLLDVFGGSFDLQALQQQFPDIDIEIEQFDEPGQESTDDLLIQPQYTIIQLEQEKECYVCIENKLQFVETCGDLYHQLCKECFDKTNKFQGCPMCRKDIKGYLGKKQIQDFFADTNNSVYIDLYQIYQKQILENQDLSVKMLITITFGDINDLELFLEKVIQKTNQLIQDIFSLQEQKIKQELRIIRSIMSQDQTQINQNINEFAKLILFSV